VFSPWYAAARRRGAAEAIDHSALNVALYGPHGKRWAMTERGGARVTRSATTLQIGPSRLHWDGQALVFDIDEVTAPWPSRIRGRVRMLPHALVVHHAALDGDAHHYWCPIAPSARVEVQLDAPALRWSGEGYCDSNFGDEPLEARLQRWNWSRAAIDGGTAVLYDVRERNGGRTTLAHVFARDGSVSDFDAPPTVALPASGWRIARTTRSDDGQARIVRTLEDTPFYARSVVGARVLGQSIAAVHESLDLDRFRSRIVQAMLPFKAPRRA
jgi:carotenoid 1,2-hydratase